MFCCIFSLYSNFNFWDLQHHVYNKFHDLCPEVFDLYFIDFVKWGKSSGEDSSVQWSPRTEPAGSMEGRAAGQQGIGASRQLSQPIVTQGPENQLRHRSSPSWMRDEMVLTSLHDRTTGTGRTFWNFLHFNILITAESQIVLAFFQGSRRSVVWVPWGLRSDILIALDGSLIPAVPDVPAGLNHRDVLSSVVSIAHCFLLYLTQSSKSLHHKKVHTCFVEI